MHRKESRWGTEKHVMEWTVIRSGLCTHAAIISQDDGCIRANHPPDFIPPEDTIAEVLAAYNGQTDGIAKHGIMLGPGIPVKVPAKIYEKMLYGSDETGGGCVFYKSKECLLLVVYIKNPAEACRLAGQTGTFLEDQGL